MARASSSPLFSVLCMYRRRRRPIAREVKGGNHPGGWIAMLVVKVIAAKSRISYTTTTIRPRDDLIYFFHPSGLCKRFFFGGGWRMRERGNIYFWQGPFVVHQGHTRTHALRCGIYSIKQATSVSPIAQIRPKRRRRRRRRRRP